MIASTLFDRALSKVKEKTHWRKLLAVSRGVNPSKIDELIASRDGALMAIIYQMAGMSGKNLLANTNVKRMINIVVETAAKSKRLYFMTGPTGCGKSFAAEAIVSDLLEGGYHVGYIRMTEANGRYRLGLWNDVANAFPTFHEMLAFHKRDNQIVYRKLVEHFNTRHAVLILDEAQKLGEKNLEALRDLYDQADISLVFMASSTFYERMKVDRLDRSDFGQFLRRADDKYLLVHAQPSDVKEFVSLYGIKLETKETKRIAELIGKHGDIDTLSRAFRLIATLHEVGELEWRHVGAGDIEDAIHRIIIVQRVDNLIDSEAA